jgi:hypothetical protein
MPQTCDGSTPKLWSAGVSASGFETDIVFEGERVRTRQTAGSVSIGRAMSPGVAWSLTGSFVGGGEVEDRDVKSGGALSAGISYLSVYETPRRPWVAVTGSVGAARVRALADDGRVRDWTAGDVRIGGMTGKSFGPVVPYVAARAFGGPVNWRREGANVSGGDAHHVTAGAGFTIRLPGSIDFTAEVMPLGERSASAGLTIHL